MHKVSDQVGRHRWLWLAVLFTVGVTVAVSAQDFKKQYKNAGDFYKEGKYNLAMEAYKPLMVYDKNNPYTEYASFYYALAALNLNYSAVARDMLLQIRKLYPEWDQRNEVNYWLAKIYFDKGEYFQGMRMLLEVKQEDYLEQQEIAKLKRYYLARISDPEVLRMMWEEYPEDAEVGKALARAISLQSYVSQDQELLSAVIAKFNLPREKYTSRMAPEPVFKDTYTISVLFPFLASTLEPTPNKKQNQLILDLYEGMRMGADTLFRQGTNIRLLAYDTERSPSEPERGREAIRKLLETDELKNTDLIVGPIFREELKPVQDFSQARWINMINPVSNNSEYIGQNPFAMLFQPSLETLGTRSAELLAARTKNKKCMVLYGDAAKDSVMAANFLQRAREVGLEVVWSEQFKKETAERIISILARPTEFDEFKNPTQFTMKLDSIGSIYVPSDNPLIYTKVISSVEARGDSVLIVGNESWLDNPSVDLSKYEKLHIMFAAPNFTPYTDPSFLNYRKAYIRSHGSYPPEYMNYTKVGFEFMMIIGQALKKYGVYFQDGLSQAGPIDGRLTKKFHFSPRHDNIGFPFVYFRHGDLVAIE
ncbi:MAG: ABC transporter substrate-binding protein [Cyclobacteriaceae bacterium]|nr:ABC transporter substrate-binding protein [Cyclobacteriaceae bacterium]